MAAIPWSAGVLLAAAVVAWFVALGAKSGVRPYLRLACAMYGAVTVAVGLDMSVAAVLPIAATLAAAFLALAAYGSFRRPAKPAVTWGLTVGGGVAGIASALFGDMLLVVLSQAVSLLTMLAVSRRGVIRLRGPSILLAVGALSLGAACCTLTIANRIAVDGVCLFTAAGLLGVVLAVARISDTWVRRMP